MSLVAQVVLNPGGFIAWVFVGLLAGWLAGKFMSGGGYGILRDILLGLVGSLIGGFVWGLFGQGIAGFWGSVLIAFVGACILIGVVRAIKPKGV